MAAKTDKQLAQLQFDLEQLNSGIQTHTAEIGDIANAGPEVTALLTALTELNAEQERLKAATEVATAQLKEKVKEAKAMRTSLRMQLKGRLGPKNELLEAFGITVK